MSWPVVEQLFRVLNVVTAAALFVRLWRGGILGRYRMLAAYLILAVAFNIGTAAMSTRSTSYAWAYLAARPVNWLIQAGVVLEIFRLIFARHAGIATAARWSAAAGLVVAMALSVALMQADFSNSTQAFPTLLFLHAVERALVLAQALLLLGMGLFLSWFPVPISRNVALYFAGWGVWSVLRAAVFLSRNLMGPEVAQAASVALLALAVGFQAGWAMLLTPAGETAGLVAGVRRDPADAERLIRRLDQLNNSLIRAAER